MNRPLAIEDGKLCYEKQRVRARGVHKRGEMNGGEAEYAQYLEQCKRVGAIVWYAFEPFKLKLAKSTFYEFDFCVMLPNGELEIHEYKGHWEDDARAKFKIAAAMFPFRFIAITKKLKRDGGGWQFEVFD